MAERLNAHDSKSCYAGMYTRVQIPFSAPQKSTRSVGVFLLQRERLAGKLAIIKGSREERYRHRVKYMGGWLVTTLCCIARKYFSALDITRDIAFLLYLFFLRFST